MRESGRMIRSRDLDVSAKSKRGPSIRASSTITNLIPMRRSSLNIPTIQYIKVYIVYIIKV